MRYCSAEYAFQPPEGVDEAIGMEEGERLIYHGIDDVDPSWSIVERADVDGEPTGERGVVPCNYIEIHCAETGSEAVAGGDLFVDDASVKAEAETAVVSTEEAPAPAPVADDPGEGDDAEVVKPNKKKKKKKKRKKWRMPTLGPEEHAAALAQAVASRRRCSSRKQSLEAATRTLAAAAAAATPIAEGDAEAEDDAEAEEANGAAPSAPFADPRNARIAALVAERDEAIREAREEVEARAAAVAELRAELRRTEEMHAGELAAKDVLIAALRSALAQASAAGAGAGASAVAPTATPRRRSAAAEAIALKIVRARGVGSCGGVGCLSAQCPRGRRWKRRRRSGGLSWL